MNSNSAHLVCKGGFEYHNRVLCRNVSLNRQSVKFYVFLGNMLACFYPGHHNRRADYDGAPVGTLHIPPVFSYYLDFRFRAWSGSGARSFLECTSHPDYFF